MATGDSRRVRDALSSLDFFAHADLFMSPTAELADIVLPVTSAWEAEALRIGFEVSQDAVSHVQLRRPVVARRGECRSDLEIIFAIADRLGLGEQFFDGDIEAAWRHQLEPSGLSLEQLRAEPGGITLGSETRHRKFAAATNGGPAGFRTDSKRIDLYSEAFQVNGYDPLPVHVDPSISHASHPEWAVQFPLTLTGAKSLHFCETQHRQVERLRSRAPDPEVEIHPDTAAARGIGKGDWVRIDTPFGSVTARAALDANLDPNVVVGQHGWWQGCKELGIPDDPPYEDGGTNLNLVTRQSPSDPISGSSPLRASVCDVALAE
jgi:anaerobic selenocysteine-containing dehydrogenase